MSDVYQTLDEDRISNLPQELKHIILHHLPVHEAVRTCVLSKAWRNTWTTQPFLVLNKQFYLQVISNKNEEDQLSAFSTAVDKILSVHTDPILDFEIFIPPQLHNHHIRRWIQHLSGHDIKLLQLDNSENDACLVPSSFFDYANLKGLRLDKWILSPPPEYRCFSNLLCADLIGVRISAPISFGAQLQDLELQKCTGIQHLDFANVKNLRRLIMLYSSKIDWRWLGNAENLEQLALVLTPSEFIRSKSVNLIRLLSNCTRINVLFLHDFLLEILGPDFLTVKTYARKMVNLKTLNLCFLSYDFLRISKSLCLIRNLPNLEKLKVTLDFHVESSNSVNPTIERYLESLEDGLLNKLRTLEIHGVVGTRSELQFSKILLASSPSLKEISVSCCSTVSNPYEKMRIKHEFLLLPKKSRQARFLWTD